MRAAKGQGRVRRRATCHFRRAIEQLSKTVCAQRKLRRAPGDIDGHRCFTRSPRRSSSPREGRPRRPTPAPLLTKAEAEAIVGQPLPAPSPGGSGECHYGEEGSSVEIIVYPMPLAFKSKEAFHAFVVKDTEEMNARMKEGLKGTGATVKETAVEPVSRWEMQRTTWNPSLVVLSRRPSAEHHGSGPEAGRGGGGQGVAPVRGPVASSEPLDIALTGPRRLVLQSGKPRFRATLQEGPCPPVLSLVSAVSASASTIFLSGCGEESPTQPSNTADPDLTTASLATASNTWAPIAPMPGFGGFGPAIGVVPSSTGPSKAYVFGGTNGAGGSGAADPDLRRGHQHLEFPQRSVQEPGGRVQHQRGRQYRGQALLLGRVRLRLGEQGDPIDGLGLRPRDRDADPQGRHAAPHRGRRQRRHRRQALRAPRHLFRGRLALRRLLRNGADPEALPLQSGHEYLGQQGALPALPPERRGRGDQQQVLRRRWGEVRPVYAVGESRRLRSRDQHLEVARPIAQRSSTGLSARCSRASSS